MNETEWTVWGGWLIWCGYVVIAYVYHHVRYVYDFNQRIKRAAQRDPEFAFELAVFGYRAMRKKMRGLL